MFKKKCDLSVTLDRPERRYAVGDVVSGFVGVEVNADATCRALTLTLRWHTHGRGNSQSQDIAVEVLFAGEWTTGETHVHPFEVRIPDGPLTYHGALLNVDWEVRARADIPWALDPKAAEDFVVVQSAPPRRVSAGTLEPVRKNPTGRAITVIGAVFTVVAAVGCVGMGLSVAAGESEVFFLGIPGIFGVFGLIMLLPGARRFLAELRLGRVGVHVTPELRPGEAAMVTLTLSPRRRTTVRSVRATLTAREICTAGSGTKRRTYRHILHQETVLLSDGLDVEPGAPVELVQALQVPARAPGSFRVMDNEIRWNVVVNADIARWPDWKHTELILVRP